MGLGQRFPEKNYVGIDIKGSRMWTGARQVTALGLTNVAFLRTSIELIDRMFAPGEVSEIWITFPDPQMKKASKRLTSTRFLERYRHVLRDGGLVHLKTDSMFLHRYSRAVAERNSLRILGCTEDLYGTPQPDRHLPGLPSETVEALYEVQTFYEKMFLEQGYKITYLSFVIDHDGPYEHPDFDEEYWRSVEGPRLLFGHDSAETRRQKLHPKD